MAGEGDRRADPEVTATRRSRALDGVVRSGGGGRRSVAVALASTVVFFGLVVFAVTRSSGWPAVRAQFFDRHQFAATFPEIAHAFLLNVKIFSIAEVLILHLSLTGRMRRAFV